MKRRGFTILELLVALSITLVLAGMLLVTTTNLLQIWRRAHATASKSVDAKLVLDQLERDVQSAVSRIDGFDSIDVRLVDDLAGHGWESSGAGALKPSAESLLLVPPPPSNGAVVSISNARFGVSGAWLRLLASDYDSSAGSPAPSTVGYQIVRRRSGTNGPIGYALYRSKIGADDTFSSVLGSAFTNTAPSALNRPTSTDVIASNVVDFGVWIFAPDASGALERIFPTSASQTSLATDSAGKTLWVMVRVLSDEGATQLEAIEAGRVTVPAGKTAAEWWWEIVLANSQVFSRQIVVQGGRL